MSNNRNTLRVVVMLVEEAFEQHNRLSILEASNALDIPESEVRQIFDELVEMGVASYNSIFPDHLNYNYHWQNFS